MAVDLAPTFINLRITSSLTSFSSERKFPASTTVGDLKGKLELVTGATATLSELELYDGENRKVCKLEDSSASLASCGVEDGFRVHVINNDPSKSKGEFDDLSKVEKYEMSDDAYSKRTDSVLAFKKRMKLGRFSDQGQGSEAAAAEAAAQEEREREEAEAISVGARCEVTLPGITPRRGTVMFVGKTHFKSGYFIGVKYDEPIGKHDGSVEGKRYFECPPKYGAFVRAKHVTTGDFPEESFSDDDDEM